MATQSVNEREKAIALALIGIVIVIIIILFAGTRGATIFPGFNYTPPNPVVRDDPVPKPQQYTNPVWPVADMPVYPGYLPPGLDYDPYGLNPTSTGGGCCGCP